MGATFFFDKQENVSSLKRQLNRDMYNSRYPWETGRGGTTFTGKHMNTRIGNNGRLMSWSVGGERGTTYFDSNNRRCHSIAPF